MFPVVQDTAFVTEQILFPIIISKIPAINYRSFKWFNRDTTSISNAWVLFQISHSSILSQNRKKKGKMDSHANGQDQEKYTGQRHACTCMLNCFSKLHHHLNITLKIPLENHLCALHCKKWWFWNQRQWITKCLLSGKQFQFSRLQL